MSFEYDYLIVGCGLFGSVFAREMQDSGKKCLIIDKRNHIGGNVYTENIEGINVHVYGPHIFHTSDQRIWNYINKFASFNTFRYEPLANYRGEIYNLPFNMNTFCKMWNLITPGQAVEKIKSQISKIHNPKNLEEFALSTVGKDIYDKLIKGYTMKQWGTDPKNLPVSIIKRIPLRFRYDNNYFNDTYQGIPIGGYTNLVKNILSDVEVRLNTDYLSDRDYFNSLAKNIVYTGKIDEFFDYQFGELKYRSLRFETETLDVSDYQGVAGMNFTDQDTPYTRIIEHKHFDLLKETKSTIITKEFPKKYESSDIPYYPVNDEVNNKIYHKYKELSTNYPNIIFGGRLAEYKYYDMHQIIGSALSKAEKILKLK